MKDKSAPTKLLFACSRNKTRSLAAEKLLEGDPRFAVRSRGTERNARIKLTGVDIGWADLIFAMGKRHAERMRAKYPEATKAKRIVILAIKDIYRPDQPELLAVLKRKLEPYLR